MKDSDWQILWELYKTPNMTKVANLLYISQPSLSKRLQSIEEEFHVEVVKRTAKGLEFTRQGELLAKKAQEYMVFMQQIKKELLEFQEEDMKIIVIGASYTYSKFVLSDLLYEYTSAHPNVKFEIQNDQSNLIFQKVCDGEIDVAFVRGDYEGGVIQKKISECQAYILSRNSIELSDLLSFPRIAYKTNDRTKDLLDDWWEQTFHVPVPVGMSAGYIDISWQLASKGLGYVCCFLPEGFDNSYHLTLTPIYYPDGKPVLRNTWLVYKEDRGSRDIHEFIKYIDDKINKKGDENQESVSGKI